MAWFGGRCRARTDGLLVVNQKRLSAVLNRIQAGAVGAKFA